MTAALGTPESCTHHHHAFSNYDLGYNQSSGYGNGYYYCPQYYKESTEAVESEMMSHRNCVRPS